MELKELAGERDMFDVMKKEERKKKKQEKKLQKQPDRQYVPNLFDIINRKLHGKKGNWIRLNDELGRFCC
jgi:hypothetical protein